MKKEQRTAVFDDEINIEAYRFEGIIQPFPNHFHEHYVIGLVEEGRRRLCCKNREYDISRGSIVIFNPGDNHGCAQIGEEKFDYRGLNISKSVMEKLAKEMTGNRLLPGFSQNVIWDEELVCRVRLLHNMIMNRVSRLGKEETLLLLISELMQKYGQPFENCISECRAEVEKACEFMRQNFSERISLADICGYCGLSSSTLLRAFAKSKGVTPYRYLEAVRIDEAKKLLERGVSPIETAVIVGFSDQSHFTNYFSSFIGLAPGAYREIFKQGM